MVKKSSVVGTCPSSSPRWRVHKPLTGKEKILGDGVAVNEEVRHSNDKEGFPRERQHEEARRIKQNVKEGGGSPLALIDCLIGGLTEKEIGEAVN